MGLDAGTKVKTAVELILNLLERDEQVVVFAKYKQTVHRIVQGLQAKHADACAYTGDLPADTREREAQRFISGEVKVLVGTLDSLSEGVDGLQHASSTVVMVDRHWTHAKNDQAIGRLRRSGQVKRVTVYHVFAKDTIDATISAACLRKLNVTEQLKGKAILDTIYGRI